MKPHLKAVVFKTPRLKETMYFFSETLGFSINEYSLTHFVIHSKGIRIVYIESDANPGVELYLCKSMNEHFSILEDPNQIKIIIT